MLFESVGFNDDEYVDLLEKLISHTKKLQNNPEAQLIPEEKLIAEEVKNYLGAWPGLSVVAHDYSSDKTRPNLIIRYKHPQINTKNTISFMGSHMDVVPADPKEWTRDPFYLGKEILDNDLKLHGRGTTDCLGHIALISVMIKKLAQKQIKLDQEIVAVFIADEEHGGGNVGVFRLHKDGLLDDFKNGPIYWVDTATDDGLFGPRVGTAGIGRWRVTITGKSGHSGYPHHCINPISIGVDLMNYINKRFVSDFQTQSAQEYARAHLYPTSSNCKCTEFNSISPSKNTIPTQCVLGGDVRFTPDFDASIIKSKLPTYVNEFKNLLSEQNPENTRADGGKYYTFDEHMRQIYAAIEFAWDNEEFSKPFAADMNSEAFKNILKAMSEIRDRVQPFSALGSLPLIYELSKAGFNLVPIGFGRQKAYHAPNEYCLLSEMRDGYKVMVRVIELFTHYSSSYI